MSDVEPKFCVGQRVICSRQIVQQVNWVGYYGHVVTIDLPDPEHNSLNVPMYGVRVQGRAGDEPCADHMVDTTMYPVPFFEPELDAAD